MNSAKSAAETLRWARLATYTALLLLNATQMIIVCVFFLGGQGPDAFYIYLNVGQFAAGAVLTSVLAMVLMSLNVSFSVYCALIPPIMHTILHIVSFLGVRFFIAGPHTIGELAAALTLMLAAATASNSPVITFLHNA